MTTSTANQATMVRERVYRKLSCETLNATETEL